MADGVTALVHASETDCENLATPLVAGGLSAKLCLIYMDTTDSLLLLLRAACATVKHLAVPPLTGVVSKLWEFAPYLGRLDHLELLGPDLVSGFLLALGSVISTL